MIQQSCNRFEDDEIYSILQIKVPKSKAKTIDHLPRTALDIGMVIIIRDWSGNQSGGAVVGRKRQI